MPEVISDTSSLLYLYRIEAIEWLPELFSSIWVLHAVAEELQDGARRGYDVPILEKYHWIQITDPRSMPSEWLSLALGLGELAAMALALENRSRIVLLDDMLARRTAQAAGLTVWGTLKVLLEAKSQGITDKIEPFVTRLSEKGMWLSGKIRKRILGLAGESS